MQPFIVTLRRDGTQPRAIVATAARAGYEAEKAAHFLVYRVSAADQSQAISVATEAMLAERRIANLIHERRRMGVEAVRGVA